MDFFYQLTGEAILPWYVGPTLMQATMLLACDDEGSRMTWEAPYLQRYITIKSVVFTKSQSDLYSQLIFPAVDDRGLDGGIGLVPIRHLPILVEVDDHVQRDPGQAQLGALRAHVDVD